MDTDLNLTSSSSGLGKTLANPVYQSVSHKSIAD
jgi:hypothetical protein